MLDALQNPVVIAVVVLVLLILIAIPVLLRRRRAAQDDVLPPPELGQAVDYTSLPYEEPQTPGERLRAAPIGVKLLLGLVPLALIIAAVVLYLTFFSGPGEVAVAPTPAPPPPEITKVTATLTRPSQIVVEGETTLPNGTPVSASMKEGDADLAWYNKDTATANVSGGRVRVVLEKANDAPTPKNGAEQTVTLVATVNGQVVSSEPAKLTVPSIYSAQFYGAAASAPTPAPTAAATAAPKPTATQPPQPTAAPTTAPAPALKASVFNGGNIRQRPVVESCANCPQLHAGEEVTIFERSNDGKWYRVKAPEGEGWVSATLLTVPPEVAQQVPVATPAATGLKAKVFNGGNVRERPVTGKVLDQINAGEEVSLLEKTSDGGWYRITNIRGATGWVSVTLLTIDPAMARQVPVAR
jgi:SH3-like domain-containing protein